ncbi:MAG: hypothetical protein ACKVRP_00940 [Bacteroidota bacterium]
MTTKAPSSVKQAPENAIEKLAYAAVASIPTVDPHDQDRLGYNVWRWLTLRRDPLDIAVKTAGARLKISDEEAVQRIKEHLQKNGIQIP